MAKAKATPTKEDMKTFAEELLKEPRFDELLNALKSEVVGQIFNTKPEESDKREQYYATFKAIEHIKPTLRKLR